MAASARVIPAQLNFLTIYCPRLGISESTEREQILFYYSRHRGEERLAKGSSAKVQSDNNSEDERLRHVGFVRGIVNFAREFNTEQNVDSIETEKHRIIVTQLETGWWILASVDLTQLPSNRGSDTLEKPSESSPSLDYSSREVSPPALLIQQLLRAHRIFLLHNGPNLADLYVKLSRDKFCNLLDDFWSSFARNWYVFLHGNPVADIYGGIKLAAGGELGFGVGEEEWGSGEREVLEGLAHGEDGLIDLNVSRFGDMPQKSSSALASQSAKEVVKKDSKWMGEGFEAGPADGLIFSGLGNISRSSLRQIADWNHWIYMYGESAYGVGDNPGRRKRKRKHHSEVKNLPEDTDEPLHQDLDQVNVEEPNVAANPITEVKRIESHPRIPPPIVSAPEDLMKQNLSSRDKTLNSNEAQSKQSNEGTSGSETLVKFLTLGYGSVWGTSTTETPEDTVNKGEKSGQTTQKEDASKQINDQNKQSADSKIAKSSGPAKKTSKQEQGEFLIGFRGDPESMGEDQPYPPYDQLTKEGDQSWNSRISRRTLYVEVKKDNDPRGNKINVSNRSSPNLAGIDSRLAESELAESFELRRVGVIVYVKRPFIFTFMFEPTSLSLQLSSFFQNLHRNLLPLHTPLLNSTSPSNVLTRLQSAQAHLVGSNAALKPNSQIYDLVYDPTNLTLRTSIPNIPLPGTLAAEGLNKHGTKASSFTRLEALSLHSQLLVTLKDAWSHTGDKERSIKTNKGWWIVWMRLPATRVFDSHKSKLGHREAILIRKAEDSSTSRSNRSSEKYNMDATGFLNRWVGRDSSGSWGSAGPGQSGPIKASEGIGVDVRKYVEGVLSLNR